MKSEVSRVIDHSLFTVKNSNAFVTGTADDATNQQLQGWYGQQATQTVLAQYAVKMIDNLSCTILLLELCQLLMKKLHLRLLVKAILW